MKIAVLGDGGWGTALAILLKNKGLDVFLWGAFKDNIDHINTHRENREFLPGVDVPKGVRLTCDTRLACKDAELIVFAIPSRFLRQVLVKNIDVLRGVKANFVSVIKGIEETSLKRMSEVVFEILGDVPLAVLSGPSIAPEVARGIPTGVVISSSDDGMANKVRDIFMTEGFRVYTNKDMIGVELGGSLKNIIAIAAGISDGLGFGTNTKGALMTRGLIEMARLGTALGARRETFSGLSGLGDLVTTCVSMEGRNRNFGEKIGKGLKPRDILDKSAVEIEGVWTSKAALLLGKRHNVELPIAEQVCAVLFEARSPLLAVSELMKRGPKPE